VNKYADLFLNQSMIESDYKKKPQEGGNATANKIAHQKKAQKIGELMKGMHEEVVNRSNEYLVDIAKENIKNTPWEQLSLKSESLTKEAKDI